MDLLTGSSGFLGKIILEQLKSASIRVQTLGRGRKVDINADLGKSIPDLTAYNRVIHVAGKAHIYPKSEDENQEFFTVNEKGTIHLCQALEKTGSLPKQMVFISSVAVYGREFGLGIREDDPLLGDTPYALSKIRAEAYLLEWGKQHGVKILILRLPLIAGPNPPGNLGNMIKAIPKGRYVSIGGGKARKSMVLATDVAELILKEEAAEGIYNLTDGMHPSFRELEEVVCFHYGIALPKALPLGFARIIGKMGDILPFLPVNSGTIDKMVLDLTFDDSKARHELAWKPQRVLDHLMDH